LETGELSDAEAAEGADQDQGPVSGVNRIGECHDLVDGEGIRFGMLDPWELDVSGGGEGDEAIPYGESEHAGCDLVCLLDRCRRFPGCCEVGDPGLEIGGLDAADGFVSEVGEDQRVEVGPVACSGGCSQRRAAGHPLLRHRPEQRLPGSRVDPFPAVELDELTVEPPLGVNPPVKRLRPPPAVGGLIPGAVSPVVSPVDRCAGHRVLPPPFSPLSCRRYVEPVTRNGGNQQSMRCWIQR
jgi:hypothetical protein